MGWKVTFRCFDCDKVFDLTTQANEVEWYTVPIRFGKALRAKCKDCGGEV
jgi:hypothetical protein